LSTYNPHVKRTFGQEFQHDLELAKSGSSAPGGRSDGSCTGIDLDNELRHDIRAVQRHNKPRRRYPTTRTERAVRSILKEIERSRP
jgi:hypothetical protein